MIYLQIIIELSFVESDCMSNSLFQDKQQSHNRPSSRFSQQQMRENDQQHNVFMFSENYNSSKIGYSQILKLLIVLIIICLLTAAYLFIPDIWSNYPLNGKAWTRTNLFYSQVLNQYNMDVQTLQIAKYYLKIGLQQPQPWLIQKQKDYYQKKYHLQQIYENYLNKLELPFCIVVPSYNNAQNKRYMLPLVSILRQNYSNYRIVYIDDASSDGTSDLVQQFKKTRNLTDSKLKVKKNTKNKGVLQNQYQAGLNQCGKQQIYVLIDGDDGLVGTQVFKLLNHFYQTSDSWFVYSNYIDSRTDAFGVSNKIPEFQLRTRSYRQNIQPWVTSHLKSFYNMLLHKMNKVNLMDRDSNGKQNYIFKVNADRAIAYQVVEMSGNRVTYVPQILYIYLSLTPYTEIVTRRDQQIRTLNIMKSYTKEKQLNAIFQNEECLQARAYLRKKLMRISENTNA